MTQYEGETVAQAVAKGLAALKIAKSDASIQVIQKESRGFLGIGKKPALVEVSLSEAAQKARRQKREQDIRQDMRTDAQNDPQRRQKASNQATSKTPSKAESKTEPAQTPSKATAVKADETATAKQQDAVFKPVVGAAGPDFNRNDERALRDLAVYLTDLTKRLGAPALVRVDRSDEQITYHLDTAKEGLLIGKHGRSINSLQYLSQTFFNHRGKTRQLIVLNVGDYRQRRQRALTALAKRTARNVIADHQAVYLDPMPSFERKLIHQLLADSPYVETYSEGNEPDRYVIVTPRKAIKLP